MFLQHSQGGGEAVFSLFGQDRFGADQPGVQGRDRLRHHLGDLLIEPGIGTVQLGRLPERQRARTLDSS